MTEESRKKYGGLIGTGLMACWLFSLLFCYGIKFWMWRYLGFAIVTTTMIGTFLYIDSLEEDLRKRRVLNGVCECSNEE